MTHLTTPEFQRCVTLAELDNPLFAKVFTASDEECQRLANRLGLLELPKFSVDVTITPTKVSGVYRLHGRLHAALAQTCIITLDKLTTTINETFTCLFGEEKPLSLILSSMDDEADNAEIIEGDAVDVGEIATQFLALAVDPYPRRADADLADYLAALDIPMQDNAPSTKQAPFASLSDLYKFKQA